SPLTARFTPRFFGLLSLPSAFFSFLVIPAAPSSTLFPYTTLFRSLLEDKLCLIFKLAPSVCRMTFPILASLLVRLERSCGIRSEIGRAVQQECRDRSRMPSSA